MSSQAGQGGHPQGTASIREGGPEMGWENGSQPTNSSCNSCSALPESLLIRVLPGPLSLRTEKLVNLFSEKHIYGQFVSERME